MSCKKIALIGMMGSGKSAVSKKLAEKLNIEHFEADEIFEKENSILIKDFFKEFGEDEFRKKEAQILENIIKKDSFVLSCGGGVVLSEQNRKLLFESDVLTIYLSAEPETIYSRIKEDKTRPLLLVSNPEEEIKKILSKRKELYELAKVKITVDNKTIEQIVGEITEHGKN